MKKAFINDWIELIRPLFPPNARVETIGGNDVVLRIDWKLGNTPNRPNKRSRLIRVIISEEVIEDCEDFKLAGTKFFKVIQKKMASFDPEHDQPRGAAPPVENWTISTFDIN